MSRDSQSYFRGFKWQFFHIYGAFAILVSIELVKYLVPTSDVAVMSARIGVTCSIYIAFILGYLANRIRTSFLGSMKASQRLLDKIGFQSYRILLGAGLLLTWILTPFVPKERIDLISGRTVLANTYESWYIALLLAILAAFILYPNITLIQVARKVRDNEVSRSFSIFAATFASIAILLVLFNSVLPTSGVSMLGLGYLADISLLSIAVQAFRKPSFLKAFVGEAPAFPSGLKSSSDNEIVGLCTSRAEKRRRVAELLEKGVREQEPTLYFYFSQDDQALVLQDLALKGIDHVGAIERGELRVRPESSLDASRLLRQFDELAEYVRKNGQNSCRVIIDYGSPNEFGPEEFVSHLKQTRWNQPEIKARILRTIDRYNTRLSTIKSIMVEPSLNVVLLGQDEKSFSSQIGLLHQDLISRSILVEFTPDVEYEIAAEMILAESTANLDRVAIFARKGGRLHNAIRGMNQVKFFTMTTQVSVPEPLSEQEVLIPAYDSGLALDAMQRMLTADPASHTLMVFDDLTDLIITRGLQYAYDFVRNATELIASNRATSVLFLNSEAHDAKTLATIRLMLDTQLKLSGREPTFSVVKVGRRLEENGKQALKL